ncbi:MAG: succinate dehydrogenase assembly factor 2 [Spongiibacteraceae bacterium]
MISNHEYNRIFWASRRGMLELDLILVPFVEQRLHELDDIDVQRYVQLLECEDTELFAWFLQRLMPQDPELAGIVEQILAHNRAPRS